MSGYFIPIQLNPGATLWLWIALAAALAAALGVAITLLLARRGIPVTGARRDLPGLLRQLRYTAADDHAAALARFSAAEALGELDDLRAVGPLIHALTDPHSAVRAAAARSLGKLGSPRRPLGESGAGPTVRSRILGALFPLVEHDPANEARWAAADALYLAGGSAVLRPLVAALRRGMVSGHGALAAQRWFVEWAAASGLEHLLIDVYPWFYPATRREIVSVLRARLAPGTLARLALARDSGDPALHELAGSVLEGPA